LGQSTREHIVATTDLKMRAHSLGFWAKLMSLPLLLGACAAPPGAQPARPPSKTPAGGYEPALQDRAWGVLRSPALGLKLALPEARGWFDTGERQAGAGWELRHEATGSTLSLRRWRASRLPRVDACEAELRQRTPELASIDETNLVAQREVRVPEGFVTRITLLALPGSGPRLKGQALAVGAGVGECLAAIAHTECATEAELAERLRLLDAALGHLRLSHVEDRVPAPPPLAH
jgi:hypothetical protein